MGHHWRSAQRSRPARCCGRYWVRVPCQEFPFAVGSQRGSLWRTTAKQTTFRQQWQHCIFLKFRYVDVFLEIFAQTVPKNFEHIMLWRLCTENLVVSCRVHYTSSHTPDAALVLERPVWASEEYSARNDLPGGGCWARILNEGYVNGLYTAWVHQLRVLHSPFWSKTGASFEGNSSLMSVLKRYMVKIRILKDTPK